MASADFNIRHSTLPSWEMKFFRSICSIPWKRFIENQKYMHLSDKVMNWDDSAVKEAFDSAKIRFRAKLNNLPCNLPLPDPDIYIDKVDWYANVDPKLFQDLERDEVPIEEERGNEVVILGISLLLNQHQAYSGAGWGDDDEEEVTKPIEAARGWESNSWEDQHYAPVERAKETDEWQHGQNGDQGWNRKEEYYEWQNGQNDYRGWNEREKVYGGSGEFYNYKGRGRNDWNGNWGGPWDGNNRRRENVTWSRNNGGYSGNEYQMNRGRRNNRGRGRGRGRRGKFGYAPAGAW